DGPEKRGLAQVLRLPWAFLYDIWHNFVTPRILMATIRKRGPSQWQVQVRRKGWPLQTKTFNIQAEAKTWATMIKREMDAGVFVSRNEAESTSFANA
ncbi:hypothetical protein AAIH17_36315, partial [Pseudomonas aeruginosa]